jgi:hypothetical protein
MASHTDDYFLIVYEVRFFILHICDHYLFLAYEAFFFILN